MPSCYLLLYRLVNEILVLQCMCLKVFIICIHFKRAETSDWRKTS